MKSNSSSAAILVVILLLLVSSSLVHVLAGKDMLAQAKKKKNESMSPLSSSSSLPLRHTTTTKTSVVNTIKTSSPLTHHHSNLDLSSARSTTTSATAPSLPSTLSLSPLSERSTDVPAPSPQEQQAIVQRLYVASAIAAAASDPISFNSQLNQQQTPQQQQQQQSCLDSSYIDKFILPLKDARFTHIRPCVTLTGTVISGLTVNADGDISFNIVVDPPYEGMLGPGNLDASRATSSGEHGIHIEVICQEPIVSSAPMDVGACNGYNGPDFHPSLPTTHEHVMVTGRFQIEWNEAPGGLTEIHPVYAIKTIPKT